MLKPMFGVAILIAVIAVAGGVSAQEGKIGVGQLAWLAGCWEGAQGGPQSEEHWTKPSGQSMIGLGRTVVNGRTVFVEFLQIREEEGGLVYTALIGLNSKPVPFKLIKGTATDLTFENPTHDFPQRIIYRRESDTVLAARIEGVEKGAFKGVDFKFSRVKCD